MTASSAATRTTVQTVTLIIGLVFLLVGILGFIPGVTAPYGELKFAGAGSSAMLLGLFQVSILHNLVHAAFGIVGVLAARSAALSRNFLLYGGVIYLLLWLYGLLIGNNAAANFIPINAADNWLHLALGVVMVVLGVLFGRSRA